MIQWRNIIKTVDYQTTAPPYFELTEALLELIGFTKINFPTRQSGETITYGDGGPAYNAVINRISVFKWNNIGLVLYSVVNGDTSLSAFYLDAFDNGIEWYGPKRPPTTCEGLVDSTYDAYTFEKKFPVYNFIKVYHDENYWYGSISTYSNDRFIFTEPGNKSDGSLVLNENNASDEDHYLSLYHYEDENLSVILSCGPSAPITMPAQNIIEYNDISKPEAFPFLWLTKNREDYISLPGLYLLSFSLAMYEKNWTGYGPWIYKSRRQGRKRLFRMMNGTFFYLNGRTAIIP